MTKIAGMLLWVVLIVSVSVGPAIAQSPSTPDGPFIAFVLLMAVVLFGIYPIPTYVAFSRSHPNRWVILALNLCLGGTGIVWVGCLIWATMRIHLPADATSSRGGESGLNIFANDLVRVRVESSDARSGYVCQDDLERLERLKRLFDEGVIDADQFARMKQRIAP